MVHATRIIMLARCFVTQPKHNNLSRNRYFGTRSQSRSGRRKPRARFIHLWWSRAVIIFAWASGEFFPDTNQPLLRPVLQKFLKHLKRTLHTRGFAGAIQFIKEARTNFLSFLGASEEGQAAMMRGRFGRFWGRPLLLEVQKFQGDNPGQVQLVRVLLTALSVLRGATLPTKIDLGPIASGPTFGDDGFP